MKLLFEEAVQSCYSPPEERWKRLKTWVENADAARKTQNREAYPNQYNKAEELITFYTFAPLAIGINKVGLINHLLNLAGVRAYEENVAGIHLEHQFPPPKEYLQWLKKEAKKHPVKHQRKIRRQHQSKQTP